MDKYIYVVEMTVNRGGRILERKAFEYLLQAQRYIKSFKETTKYAGVGEVIHVTPYIQQIEPETPANDNAPSTKKA